MSAYVCVCAYIYTCTLRNWCVYKCLCASMYTYIHRQTCIERERGKKDSQTYTYEFAKSTCLWIRTYVYVCKHVCGNPINSFDQIIEPLDRNLQPPLPHTPPVALKLAEDEPGHLGSRPSRAFLGDMFAGLKTGQKPENLGIPRTQVLSATNREPTVLCIHPKLRITSVPSKSAVNKSYLHKAL